MYPTKPVSFASPARLALVPALAVALAALAGCGGGPSDGTQFFPDTQADAGAGQTPPPGSSGGSSGSSGSTSDGGASKDGATVPPDPGVPCPNGLTNCGGTCVDLKSDPSNCGGCGSACAQPAGGGTAACVSFQCTVKCEAGDHVCSGVCTSAKSVATCGTSCTPCPTPSNGTATCDGASCGAQCNSGFHACGTECSSNTSIYSCGASCTPCNPPANATATCDGNSCDFTCNPGAHRCGGTCADDTSITACGASCVTCPPPPAHGTAACTGGACGFTCSFGYVRSGNACVATPTPSISISAAAGTKATGTFTLDPSMLATRLGFASTCPSATLDTTQTSYQIVRVQNPTAQTATVSIWTSKAATAGAPDLDTIIASYTALPLSDADRKACSVGVNDQCTTDGSDATMCLGQWAGLIKAKGQAVTLAPGASAYVYVASYYDATATLPSHGDFLLSIRTETLN
jgi:hypothetical protein